MNGRGNSVLAGVSVKPATSPLLLIAKAPLSSFALIAISRRFQKPPSLGQQRNRRQPSQASRERKHRKHSCVGVSARDLPAHLLPTPDHEGADMKKIARMAAALSIMLLTSAVGVQAQVSVGITIGPPPPPRVIRVPPSPQPRFVWVEGYWYPVGHHYKWHDGYWTRRPYEGA